MNSEMDYEFDDEPNYLTDDGDRRPEIVFLTPSQVEQALHLSQRIADSSKQWAVYLNGLALAGFRQWLTTRTINFSLDDTHCVILEPAIADGTSAVCHLQAKGFRLCLIATEPKQGDFRVPQPVVNHSDFAAHFYLPITVYEEQSAIALQGFIQQDVLIQHNATQTLIGQTGTTYQLPKQWLNPDLDSLLLYLNCLAPCTISLPQPSSPTLAQRVRQLLVQPVVNTAQWFQAEVQTQLDWIVIPTQTFASALRELPTQADWRETQIEPLLDSLRQPVSQGMPIAANARAAYRCFSLTGVELQLYAIVSLLESFNAEAEWSLLLVLKHQTNQPLPDGLTLEVRDLQMMQIVQCLRASNAAGCLFTEVIGALTEQFLVTIALDTGVAVTLPTLQFQPSQS
jgi:hypothetical protein